VDELLRLLGSCSPWARGLAASALAKKQGDFVPPLTRVLEGDDPRARIGAGQVLESLGERATPAVPAMLKAAARRDQSDPTELTHNALAFCLFYPGGAARSALSELRKMKSDRELVKATIARQEPISTRSLTPLPNRGPALRAIRGNWGVHAT